MNTINYKVWLSACFWGNDFDPEEDWGEWEAGSFLEAAEKAVDNHIRTHYPPERFNEEKNKYFKVKDGIPYYWICKLVSTREEARVEGWSK